MSGKGAISTPAIGARSRTRRYWFVWPIVSLALLLTIAAVATIASRATPTQLVWTVKVGRLPEALVVDGLTHRAFVLNRGDRSVSVVDIGARVLVRTVPLLTYGGTVAVDERAARVYVVDTSDTTGKPRNVGRPGHTVTMLDARDGTVLRVVSLGSALQSIAVDERAGHVFLGASGVVYVLDALTGVVLRTIHLDGAAAGGGVIQPSPCVLALDARRNRLVAAEEVMSRLIVVDSATGRIVRSTFVPFAICAQARTTLVVDSSTGRTFIGVGFPIAQVLTFDTWTGSLMHTAVYPRQDQPRVILASSGTVHVFVMGGTYARGRVDMFDARAGTRQSTVIVGQYDNAGAVDSRRGRAYLVGEGLPPPAPPDLWEWIPLVLRQRIPFIPMGQGRRAREDWITTIDTRGGRLLGMLPLPNALVMLVVDEHSGYVFGLSTGQTGHAGQNVGTGMLSIIAQSD